jgi:thymidylate kinase
MIRFVVFEGPDCCGKTTQAKEIAKRLGNNSNRAIYIHMPRVYKKELSSNFTNITNTICDKGFMENLFDNDNYCLKLLERILNENIDSNANDQIELLNQVEKLTSKKLSDFYEFANTCMLNPKSYACYYKDKKLDMSTSDRDTLGEFYKDLTSDLYLIVDRFDFSGECYNGYVMHQMLNEYAANENEESNKRALYDLGFKITMRERSRLNAISTRKTELTAKGIYFQYIFFDSSHVIEQKVLENKRDLSSYDIDRQINKYSRFYYKNVIDIINDDNNIMPNSISISSDANYDYKLTDKENIQKINDKIYNFIKLPNKYLRTEFDKNIRVF